MKRRQGFVSNSSSSSFVLFLKKEDYDEVYKGLSDLEKELVNHLGYSITKAFGFDIISISGMSGNNNSFDDFWPDTELTKEEQDELENEGASCMFDKVYKKLCEKDHLSEWMDC